MRPPAVAGVFYPGDPGALRDEVDRLLAAGAAPHQIAGTLPRALIAPHAGYPYSGPVAASAFRELAAAREQITRVVIVGPSHYVTFHGLALPRAAAFRTPLGEVALDRAAMAELAGPMRADEPHRREHAIEVELPFLQRLLDGFTLLPLLVGDASEAEVAAMLEPFADDPATLVLISSDLSHFLDHATGRRDVATAAAIERLEGERLGPDDACGWLPIRGWLALARHRGLAARRLDLRNSGDTAGGRASVVGYGAWAFG